ncbi:MAG TPA: hypothetical protein VF068_11330 [Rubrobacter sp.]
MPLIPARYVVGFHTVGSWAAALTAGVGYKADTVLTAAAPAPAVAVGAPRSVSTVLCKPVAGSG